MSMQKKEKGKCIEDKNKSLFSDLVDRKWGAESVLPFQKPTRWQNIYKCQPEAQIKRSDEWVHCLQCLLFTGVMERMLHNISVSMAEDQMRDGKAGLTCNVTAPCRLEAEVWLCEKGQPGGQCEEVWGSRTRLHNHADASWFATPYGHLVKTHRNTCSTVMFFSGNTLLAPLATNHLKWLIGKKHKSVGERRALPRHWSVYCQTKQTNWY